MKRKATTIILAFIVVILLIVCCVSMLSFAKDVPVLAFDDIDSSFSIETYKDLLPQNMVLDYLLHDLNADGKEELVVAYYTVRNNETEALHGFSIWDPDYSCIAFSFDDSTLQYLHGSLSVNGRGNIELLLYNTNDEWDLEQIELHYSVVDGSQTIHALNGVRYTLELYDETN